MPNFLHRTIDRLINRTPSILGEPNIATVARALVDGQGRAVVEVAPDGSLIASATGVALFDAMGSLSIAPSGPVEGAALTAYGNSYLVPNPALATSYYVQRLPNRLRAPTLLTDLGVSGWMTADCCTYAYGTYTAAAASGTRAGTWTTGTRGIVLLECARNDAGRDGTTASGGTTAKSRAGFTNALDALIRLLRASARRAAAADSAFAYSAGWQNFTANNVTGGAFKYTTTPGSACTITTPVGTDFDLILLCQDASAAGGVASTYSVSIDGGTPITGTANDGMRSTASYGGSQVSCQYAVPLRGLSSAAHTIVLTHTGSAGQTLEVDSLLVASATPPTVLIPKAAYLGAAGYGNYNATGSANAGTAVDDIYNALIDTVVARFPADGSIAVWDPNAAGWNPSTMLSSGDGVYVHPNDRGHAFYADGLMGVLNALSFRAGLNTL